MTVTYEPATPIWCAGCGHYGVQAVLGRALRDLGVPSEEVLILAGIGCSGTIQNNLGTYGYHALHGRVLPTAAGAWRANPELTVIAAGGDGDGYAIGMGHLVHTLRRNPSFTYVLMNNAVYGLTKGQDSPTRAGADTVDGVLLGLSVPGTTFIARGFARRTDQLLRLTVSALAHARAGRGFAFLEVLSPCVTYNDTYPLWEAHLYDLDEDDTREPQDRSRAFATAVALGEEDKIPVGLIYRSEPDVVDPPPNPSAADLRPATHLADYRELLHTYSV